LRQPIAMASNFPTKDYYCRCNSLKDYLRMPSPDKSDIESTGGEIFEQTATVQSWDRDYYHPIAERYYDRAIPEMLRLMGAGRGARVLDAGCGPGVHSVRAARAGYSVCAIDVSQTMLQEAQRRVANAGLTSAIEFRREDLTRLTFPNHSFRYVFSWGVIIHIRDVEKALDEFARIIESRGKLALYVTNSRAWDHKLESLIRLLLRRPSVGRESHPLGNGIWYEMHGEKLWLWQFHIPELQRQLEARGFRLTHRVIGEFSEMQRRLDGFPRQILLQLNNLCAWLKLPPGPATSNLLVFQKGD
jgi:ubiquinone/menaquinone biosynthesis C-methylase UbiE